jgi:DNA modification methylase
MTTASTLTTSPTANLDTVLHGNCVEIMSGMQSGSVDFVITDPPYIASRAIAHATAAPSPMTTTRAGSNRPLRRCTGF